MLNFYLNNLIHDACFYCVLQIFQIKESDPKEASFKNWFTVAHFLTRIDNYSGFTLNFIQNSVDIVLIAIAQF